MGRILLVVVLVLSVAACGSSSGTQVSQSQVTQFKTGVTTYDQVVSALGPPSLVEQKSDGSKILVYVHTQTSVRGATFIPVVGLFAGGADAKQQSATFTFDQGGVLKDYTTTRAQACSGPGVMYDVNAANCQNN